MVQFVHTHPDMTEMWKTFQTNARADQLHCIAIDAIEFYCSWTITINFLSIKLFPLDHSKSYFAVNRKEFADQNRQQIVDHSDRNAGTQIGQKKGEKVEKKGEPLQPLDVLGCHRRKPLCPHRQHCRVSNLTV